MALFETMNFPSWFAFQCLFKLHLNLKIGAFLRTLSKLPYLWFFKEIPPWAWRVWRDFALMPLSNWQVLRCAETECVHSWTHYVPCTDPLLFYSEHLPANSLSLQAWELPLLSPSPVSHKILSRLSQKCLGDPPLFSLPRLPPPCIICWSSPSLSFPLLSLSTPCLFSKMWICSCVPHFEIWLATFCL